MPARASFAVGRYVHDIGYWDNADGYDGAIPSWHHALRAAGHRVVSIGKLHFRGRKGDDHGFSEEIVPMHIIDGIGDVKGLIRDRIPMRKGGDKMARKAGPGESPYTVYDREIASRAQIWLHEEAPKWRDRPWVLFVSFVAPHFPLTAPARWFYRYWQQDLPLPKLYAKAERPHHPFIDDYARTVDYDPHFGSATDVKRAIAGYSGLVSSLDENIGDVLRALRESGLEARDARALHERSRRQRRRARAVGQVHVLRGERGRAADRRRSGRRRRAGGRHTGVAHRLRADDPRGDRVPRMAAELPLPGASLFAVAQGATPTRPVISEYHAIGSTAGAFMLRFRPVEVLPLRRVPAAALRPRGRPGGIGRPRRRRALRRRSRRG